MMLLHLCSVKVSLFLLPLLFIIIVITTADSHVNLWTVTA